MQSTRTKVLFRSVWGFPNWRRNYEICARYLRAACGFCPWFFSWWACCTGIQLFDSYRNGSLIFKILKKINSLKAKKDEDDDEHFSFNTSSLTQFWILLKRSFLCIMRDQMLTQLRFISHVLIGLAIGVLYNDIGNNAYYTQQNVSMIFLVTLFLVSGFGLG